MEFLLKAEAEMQQHFPVDFFFNSCTTNRINNTITNNNSSAALVCFCVS